MRHSMRIGLAAVTLFVLGGMATAQLELPLLSSMEGQSGPVTCLAFSPDGARIAAALHEGGVAIWDVSTGEHVIALPTSPHLVTSVAYSPDGQSLAFGAMSRRGSYVIIRLLDSSSWELGNERRLSVDVSWAVPWNSIMFNQDGSYVAATIGNQVRILDSDSLIETRRLEALLPTPKASSSFGRTGVLRGLSASRDGRYVVAGTTYGPIAVWQMATGRVVTTLDGHAGVAYSVSYSPDGRTVASGSADGTIKLWEAMITGFELRTLRGHTGSVRSVAYNPAGSILASGGGTQRSGEVILWNPRHGSKLHVLETAGGPVNTVAFSHDGRLLAAGFEDGTIRIWDVGGYTQDQ